MPNAQVTIQNQGDRERTLRAAFRARQRLLDHFGEGAHETTLRGVHWLENEHAYFELEIPSFDQASQSLEALEIDANPISGITLTQASEGKGDPCLNCGNIAGEATPPVCPSCGFQEISNCPYCGYLLSRKLYTTAEGQLMRCHHCHNRVRMRYNEPLFTPEGSYQTPVVLVEPAEGEV